MLIGLFSVILIACLGTAVYSNTLLCSFHFDDIPYIVDNLLIKDIHHLQGIWNWWPCRFITFFSFALNYHFNQLDVSGYHVFNLAVHLIAAIFVWWLVRLTFLTPVMKDEPIARHADFLALFAGLVFVSHPIQTQAVTFIWQRTASMAAMFYLASMCFYVRSGLDSTKAGKVLYYILSLIIAGMAMFTKENAITLPLMIVLYEFCFFRSAKVINWKRLIPFFFVFLIIPLTWVLTGAEKSQSKHSFIPNIDSIHYLLTQFRVIWTYIRLLFIPVHQNLDYDYSFSKSLFELPVFLSFAGLALIFIFALRVFSTYRLISFSIFWFFLTLLPESSFFHFGDVIFEHRLYLPLVGFSLFLVTVLYYLANRYSVKAAWIILSIFIVTNSMLTYQRNKVWKDELTLWSDIIQKSPYKARPYNSLGLIYENKGDDKKALYYYNKALEIFPGYVDALNNRGLLYYKRGDDDAALFDFDRAIELKPDLVNAYNNRGLIYAQEGDLSLAIMDFNQCIALNPDYARAYVNRGLVWARQGDIAQAMSDYNKAIELNPDLKAYISRNIAYKQAISEKK